MSQPRGNMEWSTTMLPHVLALARQAGACILAERAAGITTRIKPDGSPQTSADRAAEALIIAGLRHIWPDVPVIAEESSDPPQTYDPQAPYWLVDPLDGTKGFVNGSDDFSVNIALLLRGRPAFGVIYAPEQQELCWNDTNAAWRQVGDAASTKLSCRPSSLAGQTMITGRRTHTGEKLKSWMAKENITEHLMLSSALKFTRIAMGLADVYPRFGPTMEWDNAAGEAILHAAGGSVTTPDGSPLPYGQPHLTHHGLIARGARAENKM